MIFRKVAIIKSSKDTRYATDSIVTHDGAKYPCWALPDLSSLRQKLGNDAYEKVKTFGLLCFDIKPDGSKYVLNIYCQVLFD